MRLSWLPTFRAQLDRVWQRAVHRQFSSFRCTSISGDKSVELDGKFLESADEFQVEFNVQWPLLRLVRRCRISVRLLSGCDEGDGLPSKRPGDGWLLPFLCRVRRPLRASRRSQGASRAHVPAVGRRPLRPGHFVVEQFLQRNHCHVRVRLSNRPVARSRALRMEVRDATGRRVLRRLSFPVLDAAHAERLLLDAIQLRDQRLWICSGPRCDCGWLVADTSDFIIPEFAIPGTPLSVFQSRSRSVLTMALISGEDRIPLSECLVTLAGECLHIKGPSIPIRDKSLFPRPGPYCVVASVSHRDVGTFPFRVLGRDEMLDQVQVIGLRVDAEARAGGMLRGVRALHWQEHRAFELSVQIGTGVPAPNSSFECRARLTHKHHECWSHDFVLQLQYLCQHIPLPRVELVALGNIAKSKPARLTFHLQVDGVEKYVASIIVLPTERVSNFEGQLCLDPEDLAVEEAEYARIAGALGVLPARPRRWFRRKAST